MDEKDISQDFIYKSNEEVLPEIFWSDVPVGDTLYKLTFVDFCNEWEESPLNRKKYWVFFVYAMEPCDVLGIRANKMFLLHVPKRAFSRGYNRCFDKKKLKAGDDCDVIIWFKRSRPKSMNLEKIQYCFNEELIEKY